MGSDRLAEILAKSLARHQSRGLVDSAAGMSDVVIHGRLDLRAVIEDLQAAFAEAQASPRKSWATWFARGRLAQKEIRRVEHRREDLACRIEHDGDSIEQAIVRLRLRELERSLRDEPD